MSSWRICLLIAVILALFVGCSSIPNANGGSDNPDFKLAGIIVQTDGHPSANVCVVLIPSGYNAYKDSVLPDSMTRLTDTNGSYSFEHVYKGTYTLQASQQNYHTQAIISGITVTNAPVAVPTAILKTPGALKVTLPAGTDLVNGYLFVPGTTLYTLLSGASSGSVIINSIPAGVLPLLCYASTTTTVTDTIRHDVSVSSGDTSIVSQPSWQYSMQLQFNTSASGANVASTVNNFPVLIRLNAQNFDFSQTKKRGTDIRFMKADNMFMPYEIERWDSAGKQAELWVKVDTVYGNSVAQSITMLWGNRAAQFTANSGAVFDTVAGSQGVWHLCQPGNTTVYDATWNKFNGTPHNMTSASSVPGIIGLAQQFNGTSSFIDMVGTASGRLNFPANGTYSVSAWVSADTLNAAYHLIASKGDYQYNLQLKNTNEWQFTEFHDNTGWNESMAQAYVHTWTYITGVRAGSQQSLYINGVIADDTIYTKPGTLNEQRDTTKDFMLGKRVDFNSYFFNGKIDEVRVSSVALSSNWIKLCYMNQRLDDKLVVFK